MPQAHILGYPTPPSARAAPYIVRPLPLREARGPAQDLRVDRAIVHVRRRPLVLTRTPTRRGRRMGSLQASCCSRLRRLLLLLVYRCTGLLLLLTRSVRSVRIIAVQQIADSRMRIVVVVIAATAIAVAVVVYRVIKVWEKV